MNNNYLSIYNNLIKLTRNKKLYLNLEKQDTFSDRLIFLFLHFAFFLKAYKNIADKEELQKIFDFVIKQIEISLREIGYGDVSVNKKMKESVNLFYSIIDRIESWDDSKNHSKSHIINFYLNSKKNLDFYTEYFDKFNVFLKKNTLNKFSKDILSFKF